MVAEPIAIVGMSCRFPGAPNLDAYWQLLSEGRSAIREIPRERWDLDALYDRDPERPGKIASRHAAMFDSIDGFDWKTFRIPPREARAIDPQHRLLLELAWEAFEDAGMRFESLAASRTGVFVALGASEYALLLSRRRELLDGYAAMGTSPTFAANRISYFFDLRGPSLVLDAGCASSIAALHYAVESLRSGESSIAIAGGVNLLVGPERSIMSSKAGMLSRSGAIRTLDRDADGTVRGEGGGVLVLRRLSETAKTDRVHALILGSALNHNGRNEWIMAASKAAQRSAIAEAHARAGVGAEEIDYVELHGTGFPKGDAIEIEALAEAMGERRRAPCLVGSAKPNIGHLESASGAASVIKTALALRRQQLPPSINLETPSEVVERERLRIQPVRALLPWPKGQGPSIAGVSGTSLGGANGHLVLAAAPSAARRDPPRGRVSLVISAPSAPALAALTTAHVARLRAVTSARELADIAYTTRERRTLHAHRVIVEGSSAAELADALERGDARARDNSKSSAPSAPDEPMCADLPPCVWMRERMWVDEPAAKDEPAQEALPLVERVAAIYAEVLEKKGVAPEDNFLALGGESLAAARVAARVYSTFGIDLAVRTVFEQPTPAKLAEAILHTVLDDVEAMSDEEVARRLAAKAQR